MHSVSLLFIFPVVFSFFPSSYLFILFFATSCFPIFKTFLKLFSCLTPCPSLSICAFPLIFLCSLYSSSCSFFFSSICNTYFILTKKKDTLHSLDWPLALFYPLVLLLFFSSVLSIPPLIPFPSPLPHVTCVSSSRKTHYFAVFSDLELHVLFIFYSMNSFSPLSHPSLVAVSPTHNPSFTGASVGHNPGQSVYLDRVIRWGGVRD